jgi:hypothetical protein
MTLKAFGAEEGAYKGKGEMGHTVDIERLPEAPIVLDAGCRGFGFGIDMLAFRPKARVIALDPDPSINNPGIPGIEYFRVGLVGSDDLMSDYISTTEAQGEGGGNFLAPLGASPEKVIRPGCNWEFTDHVVHTVRCENITALMERTGVKHWDVVKLDCEECEFEILENWPGPIADQISVEFHDFTGPIWHNVQDGYYEKTLWPHLFRWYDIARHELMDLDGNPQHFGHWDSLLVLR